MIVVDKKKCVGCGLCAVVCHEQCISQSSSNGNIVEKVDHALCSTCVQCISVCPKRALSWGGTTPVPFDKSQLPSSVQVEELLKERRTTRFFKDRKIDRELIDEIVNFGIYAPTNNYSLRAILVDDPETIKALDAIIMKFVALLYTACYKFGPIYHFLRAVTPKISEKYRVKLEKGLQKGHSYDSLFTTMVFIVGDRRIPLSDVSAQYAVYNMILYAQTKRIGNRIKAAGSITLDRSREARKLLGLREHEHILGTLELGYPRIKFSNKVEGKKMAIQWRGGRENG